MGARVGESASSDKQTCIKADKTTEVHGGSLLLHPSGIPVPELLQEPALYLESGVRVPQGPGHGEPGIANVHSTGRTSGRFGGLIRSVQPWAQVGPVGPEQM